MKICFSILFLTFMFVVYHTPMSHADSFQFKANCTFSAGSSNGQKFATVKCYEAGKPNKVKLRQTIWENKDKTGYRNLARNAGRSIKCTFERARTGSNNRTQTITRYYKIKSCSR